MSTKYDVDYFIAKFEAIPEAEIGSGALFNHCALWHCGSEYSKMTPEALALTELFKPRVLEVRPSCLDDEIIYHVNDGHFFGSDGPPSPKQRILTLLRDIKAKEVL